jgi:hypothetical protein
MFPIDSIRYTVYDKKEALTESLEETHKRSWKSQTVDYPLQLWGFQVSVHERVRECSLCKDADDDSVTHARGHELREWYIMTSGICSAVQ